MAYEKIQVKNLAYATLLEDNFTTLKVAGDLHYSLPTDTSSGTFTIALDQELIKVNNITVDGSGHYIYTIDRVQEGTDYVEHVLGERLYLNITAGNFNHIQDYISLIDTTSNINLNSMNDAVALNTAKISFDSTASTKVGYLTVTQAVDLDTLESNVTTNNAKVTNATHTGEMTGATTLTADPTIISNKTGVTPVSGDYVLLWDATDSLLKKSDVSSFLGGGGSGDVTGPSSATDLALAIYDGTSGKTIKNSAIIVDTSSNLVNSTGGLHVEKAAKYISSNTLTSGTTVTWDLTDDPISKLTLAHNVGTFTLSNIQLNINNLLIVIQDDTTPYTINFPGNVTWAGGYSPEFPLGSTSYISMFSMDGTGIFAQYTNDVNTINGNMFTENSGGSLNSIPFLDSTSDNVFNYSATILDISGNLANVLTINGTSVSTLISDVAANTAKVTNANHTGDVTGATTLSIVPSAISGKTGVTPVSGDYILLWDATDSALKKADISHLIPSVTESSTSIFSNKRNLPRVNALTSGATVNWNSTLYDINTLTVGHDCIIAADTSGGSASSGEIREFLITSNGTNSVTLDTTSASYAFAYTEDCTGFTVNDTSSKTDAILVQFYNSKWNVIAICGGIG